MMDVVTGDQVVEEELSDQEEVSFKNTILIFYKSFVSVDYGFIPLIESDH